MSDPTSRDDDPSHEVGLGDDPDAELAPLGTAPTISKAEARGDKPREPRKGPDRKRRKIGIGAGSALVVIVVVVFALVPLVGTALEKTPKDKVGISYGGGPIEGEHFQKIVEPGSNLFFNGIFDRLYLYPADQQNYIVSKVKTEGDKTTPDMIVAPSKDRVQVQYQVAVYYKLNVDKLRSFHEELGLKYNAYTSSGWKQLIEDTFRQQIENALQEQTRSYEVAEIYGDAELLIKIQTAVQQTLSERLRLAVGDDYFCAPTFEPGRECGDPTFIIKKVDIPDSVVAAYEANRTSGIGILTKENEVKQREAEARGIEALSASLAKVGPVYAQLKAIESGKVTFWVVPDSSGLTLGTNGSGSAPATPAGQ